MNSHAISVEVPDTRYSRLDAITEHNAANDADHQRTLMALADVDASRILNEEQMDAWINAHLGPQPISGQPA